MGWITKLWDMQMRLNVSFQIQDKQKIYHMTVDYDAPSYLVLFNFSTVFHCSIWCNAAFCLP